MTTRTFVQHAQAYGSTTGTLTAKIDGTIVFQGPILTLNQPLPALPDSGFKIENNAFSWTNDVTFAGTQSLEITVENATVLLGDTLANYMPGHDGNGNALGNATAFGDFYTVADDQGLTISDPFSEETIDGVLQPGADVHASPWTGQYWWTLGSGSTFTATVNIQAGSVAP